MKKVFAALLSIATFTGTNVNAQTDRVCGNELIQQEIKNDPYLQNYFDKYFEEYADENKAIAEENKRAQSKGTADYVIPVVFHIVLNQAQMSQVGDTAGMIARIVSQMQVINEDFSATNADISGVPAAFTSVVGNANIRFEIAKIDPNNKVRLGIEFLVKPPSFNGYEFNNYDLKRKVMGGLDPWDNSKYLNIWVTNITSTGTSGQILGVGYNPVYAGQVYGDPALGGVAVHYLAFGKRTSLQQAFFGKADKGRTLTHELGHFFNIWHIWGAQAASNVKDCTDDDGIDDTPKQEDANTSCPSGIVKNCTLGSHPGGEMYMNYMDYSGDECTKMFTVQQVARMRKELSAGGQVNNLSKNPQLAYWPADVSAVEYNNKMDVGPNPNKGIFNIRFYEKYDRLDKITVMNAMGQLVKSIPVTDQDAGNISIDISDAPKAIYIVQLHFDTGIISRKVVVE